ncbi:hypothetical protein NEOLEDRAFT_1138857 [Neolentinus lepideus HHB14362 ss-1]|uniref:Uncharacterized protein n=1 Tax=Neolentinus lepideus HHB14362 ss-1 TaxID=1314782 RepID=A0A165Q335_9AGAM|nr:hypothetical protein NEOLEDRAFT_1138857 [Neolentinus lepideus HHB14362 ss-1]
MIALLALVAAPLVSAFPSLSERQSSGSWCSGLGGAAYDVAYNFTLAALNTSLPNANTTGAPIVLNSAANGAGAGVYGLATYNTQPGTIDTYPNFTLVHGVLTANEPSAPQCAPVSSGASSGEPVGFSGNCSAPASPHQVFCSVANTDPAHGSLPILALNNHDTLFSICHQNSSTPVDILVYNATSKSDSYNFDSCYSVTVHLVGSY